MATTTSDKLLVSPDSQTQLLWQLCGPAVAVNSIKCSLPTCDSQFALEHSRTRHLIEHHRVFAFRCPVEGCPMACNQSSDLASHVELSHTDQLTCRHCLASFLSVSTFLQHQSVAHELGEFRCLSCTFVGSTRLHVLHHVSKEHSLTAQLPLSESEMASQPSSQQRNSTLSTSHQQRPKVLTIVQHNKPRPSQNFQEEDDDSFTSEESTEDEGNYYEEIEKLSTEENLSPKKKRVRRKLTLTKRRANKTDILPPKYRKPGQDDSNSDSDEEDILAYDDDEESDPDYDEFRPEKKRTRRGT